MAETAYMECPHCQHPIEPNRRRAMNQWGQWVKDGQWIDNREGHELMALLSAACTTQAEEDVELM